MKKKIIVLLAIVLAAGAPLAPKAEAVDFSISIGDRGFYYGPNYWHNGTNGYGFPAIAIGAVGCMAITSAAVIGIVRMLGIIIGIIAITIVPTTTTAAGIATKSLAL